VSLEAGQFRHEKSDHNEVDADINSHKTKEMTAEFTMYLVRKYREILL